MSNKTNLRSIAPTEVGNLPKNIPINRDRYCFRIIEAVFGQSKSSGNNMITITAEIYDPQSITSVRDGKTYNVAGSKVTTYLTLTDKAMGRVADFMEACGMAPELDVNAPDTSVFIGKCFSAVAGPDTREMRKDLTDAEKLAGKKQGDVILREDGSPEVTYGVKLVSEPSRTSKAPTEKMY